MATTNLSKPKNAHYHAVKASTAWMRFVKAEMAQATQSAAERARVDAKRQRETTYARGEEGAH
jgi:hypothetical protein